MATTPYTSIARITKAHGLTGEVVAVPAGDLTSIDELLVVLETQPHLYFVPPPAAHVEARVTGARKTPKGILVTLETLDHIEKVQPLVGCTVLVRRDVLEDIEFEVSTKNDPDDLIGIPVWDEAKGELGPITEVILTGANDVWVVQGPYGEVLIPVIDDVVLGIRGDEDIIDVKLLEGLLPGEAEEIEGDEDDAR